MDLLPWEARAWGRSLPLRRAVRRMRAALADAKHRLAAWAGRRPASRVRWTPPRESPHGDRALDRPSAWILDGRAVAEQDLQSATDDPQILAVAETLRLVAACETLDAVLSPVASPNGRGELRLVRTDRPAEPLLGKSLRRLDLDDPPTDPSPVFPFDVDSDGRWWPPGQAAGRRLRRRLVDPFHALADRPALKGPPTVIFLLPFLAVGGAERLLFDLLKALGDRYRSVVVTVEPHRPSLGSTVKRCAELTPWIFPLGDHLPREAHFGALSALIRRFGAHALLSWNGTVFFFDRVPELRRRFPDLRILSQLYHFEGGWTARTSPSVVGAVDAHVAVNGPIRDSLVGRLAVPEERVAVIHHGVPLPAEPSEAERRKRRSEERRRLGIPETAVVLGTFIRLHPQKRPLDLLALARRFADEPTNHESEPWLVLMGGGPLDAMVDRELERDPPPRFVRLPLRVDPLPVYDALDLCLMTSDYEGLPVFLLDGMARGLPGIAPRVGDVPLLFEDGGGVVAGAPGDLDALEAAIRRLLDPEARARASQQARQTIEERFGLDRYAAAYERLIFDGLPSGDAAPGDAASGDAASGDPS